MVSGRHLVTWGDHDINELRVFDLATGALSQGFSFELPVRLSDVLLSKSGQSLFAWNHATSGRNSQSVFWEIETGEVQQRIVSDNPQIIDQTLWIDISNPAMPVVPPGWQVIAGSPIIVLGPVGLRLEWHDSEAARPLFLSEDGTLVVVRATTGITFLKLFLRGNRIQLDGSDANDVAAPIPQARQPTIKETLDQRYADLKSAYADRPRGIVALRRAVEFIFVGALIAVGYFLVFLMGR